MWPWTKANAKETTKSSEAAQPPVTPKAAIKAGIPEVVVKARFDDLGRPVVQIHLNPTTLVEISKDQTA